MSLATDFDALAKMSAEQIGRLARAFESNNCPGAEKIREAAGADLDDSDIDRIVRSFNFVLGKSNKSDWKSLLSSSSWDEEKISAVRGAIGESCEEIGPDGASELPHVHDLEISSGFRYISGGNKDYKLMIRLTVRAGLHSKSGKTDAQMQLDLDGAEKLADMLNEQVRLVGNRIRPAPHAKGRADQWQHIAHDSMHIGPCGPRVWSSKADAEARSKEFREMWGIEHTKGPVQSIAGMLDEYVKDVDSLTLIREMRGRG